MRTIMPIYGTRPEAIKMAPIVLALQDAEDFDVEVVVTGQHRAMLDQVNELFGITPARDLNILQEGQSLTSIMAKTVDGLGRIFSSRKPAAVIVQGDTTTSTAAAIAAFYHQIPVVHAEAGLRSHNIHSPFPEEANRKITTQIATLHLAPTQESRNNLLNEGVAAESIVVTGNTVIDALLATVKKQLPFTDARLEDAVNSGRMILLATTHRRENQGEAMRGIGRALARIAAQEPDLLVVLPAHLNPAVRQAVLPPLEELPNALITEPLDYGQFTRLLASSTLVLSDSGGVQEEAPSLGIPVLVLRENTERPEGVDAGTVKLVGTNENRVVDEVLHLLGNDGAYAQMASAQNPYGDGTAAEQTVEALRKLLDA